jgi:hypothetical protein
MKRSAANELVKGLLAKYESKLTAPLPGKGLYECWDPDTRRPSKEYRGVITKYKAEMADLGVELKPEM